MGNATSCGHDHLPPLRSGQQVVILAAGQVDDDHVDVGFGELTADGWYESQATVHLRSVQPASGTVVGSGSRSGAKLHVGDVVQVVRATYSQHGKHRCGTLGPVPLLLPPPPSVPGCRCQWVEGSKLRLFEFRLPCHAHNESCKQSQHLVRGAAPGTGSGPAMPPSPSI